MLWKQVVFSGVSLYTLNDDIFVIRTDALIVSLQAKYMNVEFMLIFITISLRVKQLQRQLCEGLPNKVTSIYFKFYVHK